MAPQPTEIVDSVQLVGEGEDEPAGDAEARTVEHVLEPLERAGGGIGMVVSQLAA